MCSYVAAPYNGGDAGDGGRQRFTGGPALRAMSFHVSDFALFDAGGFGIGPLLSFEKKRRMKKEEGSADKKASVNIHYYKDWARLVALLD